MAFSGLRPESLGNYDGSDGLRLGDFVEAEIRPNGIEFTKVPSMLVVRKSLSKARHQYFTFVPQQTIIYVEEYLEERSQCGLTPANSAKSNHYILWEACSIMKL